MTRQANKENTDSVANMAAECAMCVGETVCVPTMSLLGILVNRQNGYHGNSAPLCHSVPSCKYGSQMKIWEQKSLGWQHVETFSCEPAVCLPLID